MKLKIFGLVMLCSLAAHAREIRVDCDFSQTATGFEKGIQSMTMKTGRPGSFEIVYSDGANETLAPLPGTGGAFDEIRFPDHFRGTDLAERSYVQVESPRLGRILMLHQCESMGSDIYCNTRGGTATREIVRLNLGGQILKFNGNALPLCLRSAF